MRTSSMSQVAKAHGIGALFMDAGTVLSGRVEMPSTTGQGAAFS